MKEIDLCRSRCDILVFCAVFISVTSGIPIKSTGVSLWRHESNLEYSGAYLALATSVYPFLIIIDDTTYLSLALSLSAS